MEQPRESALKFPCYRCGSCCQNIADIPELRAMTDENGRCAYLSKDNMCLIYDKRPELCNISSMYNKYFSDEFSWDEFAAINMIDCVLLRNKNGVQEPAGSPFECEQKEIAEKLIHGKRIIV